MNELDVARAIAAGELTSPQKYMNFWLFAIRISGTGLSYRSSVKEYVWRDSSIYLNDDFLARCNGLAVIIEHPKGGLNTKEYKDRSVGSIMLPYIIGDEVWGVAKIYDANAAHLMETEQLSTSPMVILGGGAENMKFILESGKPLLIEGEPVLLDHIAIVPNGVWDKGGDPTGVLTQAIGDLQVAETEAEKTAREDKAKADAEAANIDKFLSHLDSAIAKHMKPLADRMDAMEMEDKRRKDAEAEHRRDAERADWHKADAAGCERDDAEEAKEREEMEGKGEAKEVAADKARRARKDRMKARSNSDEAKREREDKAKRDAEEKERKDAEGKAEKERADAILASNTSLAERLANMPKPASDADYPAMADAQARADAVYGAFGQRAPGPLQGETVPAYSRRLARGMQAHSKTWSGVDLHALPDTALAVAEGQIYADAQTAANSSDSLPDDALVQRSYTNQDTGHRITEWRGRHTFIHGLKRPSMRATAFLTGKGN